jgi:hypothetical protein
MWGWGETGKSCVVGSGWCWVVGLGMGCWGETGRSWFVMVPGQDERLNKDS